MSISSLALAQEGDLQQALDALKPESLPPMGEDMVVEELPSELEAPLTPETVASPDLTPDSEEEVPPSMEEVLADASERVNTGVFTPSFGDVDISLMYAPEDMANMRRILELYERNREEDGAVAAATGVVDAEIADIIAGLTVGQQEDAVMFDYPSFYLSTILYRSANDWAYWINGTRYANNKPHERLQVRSISDSRISFVWKPGSLVEVADIWNAKASAQQKAFRHRSASGSEIQLDYNEGTISFSLRPNQTFVSEQMEVMEGRYVPNIAIDNEPVQVQNPGFIQGKPQAPDLEREAMENLIDNVRKMQNLMPRRQGN